MQAAAATTIEEKFSDAGQVNALTGASPTVALHVLWDLPEAWRRSRPYGAGEEVWGRPGSINPNLFQDQSTSLGRLAIRDAEIRGNGAGASAGFGGDWRAAGSRMFRCGLRMGRTIRERRAFAAQRLG